MLLGVLIAAASVPVAGGVLASAVSSRPRLSTILGAGSAAGGCLAGLITVAIALFSNATDEARWPWHVPYGEFHLAISPLSSVFLLLLFGLGLLGSIYGAQYLYSFRSHKSLGVPWLFYSLLIASMAFVFMSRNGLLFLVAWEAMAIASFFLVAFEHEKAEVRSAAWTYLVAMHVGTACLLAFFAILGHAAGSLDFDDLVAFTPTSATGTALFLLALAGFGSKAGLVPLHVWLPEAHPAAPSHVSALMSGVMVKTGIYGLLVTLPFFGPPATWWGVMLITVGIVSSVIGVLFALVQYDIKRMLAYSTIENIGIITMGLGVAVWALSYDEGTIAFIAFAGVLLHVLNHGIFKGMLFFGAGAVVHATGTRAMDRLGGLRRKMPATMTVVVVGGAAISGLPLFNGFIGEFVIATAALTSIGVSRFSVLPNLAVISVLGIVGALAAAAFGRLLGVVFLGTPRTSASEHAHEAGMGLLLPMAILATLCVAIGMAPTLALRVVIPAATALVKGRLPDEMPAPVLLLDALWPVTIGLAIAGGAILVLFALRVILLRRRQVTSSVTWDCGYEFPSPRMQYRAYSFASLVINLFRSLIFPKERLSAPRGYFPTHATFATDFPDIVGDRVIRPAWYVTLSVNARLHWLQQGRLHVYLLYILLTLLVLLVWQFGLSR